MSSKNKDKEVQSKASKTNLQTAIVSKSIKTWSDIIIKEEASSSKQSPIEKEEVTIAEIQKWVETLSQSPEMLIALQNISQSQQASAVKITSTLSKPEKNFSSLEKLFLKKIFLH